MYRVLSIRGVLTKDKLDPIYVGNAPSVWLTSSHKTIKMFDGETLSVNGEYRASVLVRLLNKIALAGDRLHKINQVKRLASEAQRQASENRINATIALAKRRQVRAAVAEKDVPVGEKLFRI
jgi:hypothetical protein